MAFSGAESRLRPLQGSGFGVELSPEHYRLSGNMDARGWSKASTQTLFKAAGASPSLQSSPPVASASQSLWEDFPEFSSRSTLAIMVLRMPSIPATCCAICLCFTYHVTQICGSTGSICSGLWVAEKCWDQK